MCGCGAATMVAYAWCICGTRAQGRAQQVAGVVLIEVVAMGGRERNCVSGSWARDGRQYGPITQGELHALQTMGQLRPNDLLWREGWQTWKTATVLAGTTVSDRRVELRALVPTKPDELQDWAALSPGEFKSLRVLSPILNFLIMVGSVAKPLLEHFGKRFDAFPPWALFAVPFLLFCVYIMVGTSCFLFPKGVAEHQHVCGEESSSSRVCVADVRALRQLIRNPINLGANVLL